VSLSLSYITTDGQSASLSWNKAPIWGLRPDFYYCLTIADFLYGTPSLTRGRVCLLLCTMCNIFYCLRFETRSLYLYPLGTGWPGYTSRHWVYSVQFSVSFYNPSAQTTQKTEPLLLRRRDYWSVISNGRSSVACVRLAGTCLPSRCLAMSLHLKISKREPDVRRERNIVIVVGDLKH
jgi:hypothetical protein